MSTPASARCLATLEPLAVEGMVRRAQRELAGGNVTFPSRIGIVRQDVVRFRLQAMQRFSISGVQDKILMRLERGRLAAVERDGTHILKPIPSSPLPLVADVPANEHVTMLAARTLGIRTAACALIRLQDDELAYVTRRFDRRADGSKLLQEDFGVLAGMSEAEAGKNYKYSYSYEELGRLVARHCSAQQRDLEEYFRRVVFCFAIGNGDAHVRNFSILREADGFVQLSPAYDLLCTNVHLADESDLALQVMASEREGRFSASYEALGYYSAKDFRELADAIGLQPDARDRVLTQVTAPSARTTIGHLVARSFLSLDGRRQYLAAVGQRFAKLSAT